MVPVAAKMGQKPDPTGLSISTPNLRYKKKYVLPGGFIPGPNKPKNLDLFMYTGLHHLSALQRDGLRIWDCQTGRVFTSRPFFFLGTADGPGPAALHGQVGHHGAFGCCEYCGLRGRHKPGGPHYYPTLQRPTDYALPGCDHNDVDVYSLPKASSGQYSEGLNRLLRCCTEAQFRLTWKETGLCKLSIFLGLDQKHSSGLPGCLAIDHMHVIAINLLDLLLSLWRGTIDCDRNDSRHLWDWAVLTGDSWKAHGLDVARCCPYFPGSFDCTPRNPAEKISSGYKAWEFLLYVFGLCPALLYNILPQPYWSNFCKLVTGVQILQQRAISVMQLQTAHRFLLEFTEEYEALYYQCKVERLQFCRQSVHALSHLSPDTIWLGPGGYSSQWTLERTIGNLGKELKQPSNPYANLANCGLLRLQMSALHAILPDLKPDTPCLPRGAVDLRDGYNDDTEVSLGDGSLVKITQKGTVKLGVEGLDLTLTNVKYMPKCKTRILSPGSLIEKGARAVFYNGGVDIFLDKRCIAQGQQIGSLYWVFMQPHLNLSVDTRVLAASANLETWHQCMGHLSYETVKAIHNAEPLSVYGFKLDGLQKEDTPCHGCQLGKSHRLPFPPSSKRAEVPLEIVHSDLVGPFQTNSIQGNKYFATFIDDCSKIAVITYMKSKDQFKQAFINYKAWAENQLSHTIKCLHSDRGSEYVNNDLKHILQEAGVEHKLTVLHSPQQNGRAEHFNRTIMEKASAMLHHAGMSQGFWETAVATACHLYNRTPTRSNKWRTP
jgi:transposase InsO family protein